MIGKKCWHMPNVHQVRVYNLCMLLSKMEEVRGEKLSSGDFVQGFFGLDFLMLIL